MTLILHIETATELCSVALSKDGKLIASQFSDSPQSHAGQITLLIEDLFATSDFNLQDIHAVAVSKGPGSYTGLRVGLSTAKGLCYALSIPLIGINSLSILATARDATEFSCIIPMIDARRMEVYMAIYNNEHQLITKTNAFIIDEESMNSLASTYPSILYCGNGAFKCEQFARKSDLINNDGLSAKYMVSLAYEAFLARDFEELAYFEPFYLKSPNITQSKQNKLFRKS